MHKLKLLSICNRAVILIVFFSLLPLKVSADPLTQKSIAVGSSQPSISTTHNFNFTLASVTTIGSIEFEYCSNTPFIGTTCTAPTGLNVSGASLSAQTGETGFSIDNGATTTNKLVLARAPSPTAAVPVNYNFSGITNQDTPNSSVYVRISTFAANDATGPRTDEGAVAYSTASNLAVAGYVPPYITFCTGVTVAVNCSTTAGSFLDFGELVSTQSRFLSSQFAVSTNDPGGYSTTVSGATMTSGNNIIEPINAPQSSQPGNSQFGMNLRANSNPSVGADPVGAGTGSIVNGFNTPNQFYFKNDVIVQSPISSDFNAFTVSYLVNVNSAQPPGIYSTTLTYIAAAAF